jgi:hypothetical protein
MTVEFLTAVLDDSSLSDCDVASVFIDVSKGRIAFF